MADDTSVTLQVISHTFHVADVYLYRGSTLYHSSAHRRLGRTSGHSISTFEIPWRDLTGPAPVVIAAKTIGDTRLASTGALHVDPGSLITWTLEPDLVRTTAVVH